MKILKLGKVEPQTTKLTCYNCNTEFEYESSDLIRDNIRDETYVRCPVCLLCTDLTPIRTNRMDD